MKDFTMPIGVRKGKRHYILAAIRAEVATTGVAGNSAIRLYVESRCVSYAAFRKACDEGAAIHARMKARSADA